MEFKKNGTEYIEGLIERGIANGTRRNVANGNWEIERAIRIPSDFQLILDDCHLRMADGVFDNMFVNEHYGTDEGRTAAGTDRNISLIGRGNTILDGGTYNGLSEKTQLTNGLPPVYKNNTILFTNVDGFEIRNIAIHNQRWWGINLIYCANGEVTDIDFKANEICIDKDGNEYIGFSLANYMDVLVKTADGIDIRQGCHHILVENITGFTGDDTVGVTALDWCVEKPHEVEDLPRDMHHIKVKNVRSASLFSNVRILNQGGFPMHDILVDGVTDISDETDYIKDHGLYSIRVNDIYPYGVQPTPDLMYNITVRNVRSRAEYAMHLVGEENMKNFVYENIVAVDGASFMKREDPPKE